MTPFHREMRREIRRRDLSRGKLCGKIRPAPFPEKISPQTTGVNTLRSSLFTVPAG